MPTDKGRQTTDRDPEIRDAIETATRALDAASDALASAKRALEAAASASASQ